MHEEVAEMIDWVDREKEMPPAGQRVLTYSPCYEGMRNGHEMIYRLMDGQLVRISIDVTHWARINPPSSLVATEASK